MALLDATALLADKEMEQEIVIKGIRLHENDEPVDLKIRLKTSRKLVKSFKKIRDKSTNTRTVMRTRGKKKGDVEFDSTVDHAAFCRGILDLSFVDACGDLIDEFSVDIIMAATELFPKLLNVLSDALLDFVEGKLTTAQEEDDDDKKN